MSEKISQSSNNVSFSLFKNISRKNENTFFSPYSIHLAMSMCFAGARNKTESQLKKVLNYDHDYSSNEEIHRESLKLQSFFNNIEECKLNIANKIFHSNKFVADEEYSELLKEFYASQPESLNFSDAYNSMKIINGWVADKTNNKINNIVSETTFDNTRLKMILINAIYFKSDWKIEFEKEDTFKEKFYLPEDTIMDVNMMCLKKKSFKYSNEPEGLPLASCSLLYSGYKISMTILLPHKDQNLLELESKIDENVFKKILSCRKVELVDLYLPRFKFDKSYEISNIISRMGASDLFGDNADLSGINSKRDLSVSSIFHKCFIEVKEEGTEAAAVTYIDHLVYASAPGDFLPEIIQVFKCERPFLFFIHDNELDTILFMGRCSKPDEYC